MAGRGRDKLSSRTVQTRKEPGWYGDGAGLYLRIDESLNKRWVYVFQWRRKRREMGLGALADVDLPTARDLRDAARALVIQGIDPVEHRRQEEEAKEREAVEREKGVPTFGDAAEDLIQAIKGGWTNARTEAQWRESLKLHAAALMPRTGPEIDTEAVLAVLKPIWMEKPETADRVRRRIEHVLDSMRVRGLIGGPWENPARWKGHLARLLADSGRKEREHHLAMPYAEVPAFMPMLKAQRGLAALALELTILCALRTSEILGAQRREIDFDAKVWTIPAERMKGRKGKRKAHRVPFSARAGEILLELTDDGKAPPESFVFPGDGKAGHLSNMAMEMLLRRMGYGDMKYAKRMKDGSVKRWSAPGDKPGYTPHGFRSSFRDWVGEETSFPERLAEAALAHVAGDDTERSYRRGDALKKRRLLMEAWATYLAQPAVDNVRALRPPSSV